MPARRFASTSLVCVLGTLAAPARAAAPSLPPATVQVDSPDAEASDPLTTGTASVVDTRSARGQASDLSELLEAVPGVSVRRIGAVGSYSALSIRGLGPAHLNVVLDGLPLSTATLGPVDLSLYPPDSISRAVLYRGAGPVRYQTPLGGVLCLMTRLPRHHLHVALDSGYGSEQTAAVHANVAGPAGPLRFGVYAGYEHSRGNYLYYDDRNTLFNSSDDRLQHRRNNDFDAVSAHVVVATSGPAHSTVRLVAHGTYRRQGIPGVGAEQALHARAGEWQAAGRLSLLRVTTLGDRLRVAAGLDGLLARRVFHDPDAELGLRVGSTTAAVEQVGVDVRATLMETLSQQTELAPRFSWQAFHQSGASQSGPFDGVAPADHSGRLHVGVGLEHRWDVTTTLRLVPAVRLDSVTDTPGGGSGASTTDTQMSPRLGVLWRFGPCALRASGGRFHRFPSLIERYGDGIYTSPNVGLRPERGLSGDVGVGCHLHPRVVRRLWGRITGFATWADQLIALRPNSASSAKALNIGKNRILGVEAAVQSRWRWLGVAVAYTFTDARDESGIVGHDGKRTAGIPVHRFDGSLEIGPAWLRLRYSLALTAGLVLDNAGLRPVPLRLWHNLELRWRLFGSGFVLHATVRNVANTLAERLTLAGSRGRSVPAGIEDFLGYPLPGRTFFVALSWRAHNPKE